MSHERLKHIKENLVSCIESQMCNIYEADAEELGEAVDMLKDLEEAIYYCTITEAMEKGQGAQKQGNYEHEQRSYMQYNDGRNGMSYNDGRGGTSYNDGRNGMSYNNGNSGNGSRSYLEGGHPVDTSRSMMQDPRQGRSPEVRRMYMEARDMGKDKTSQIKELEHYMQELSNDVVEMIQEAGSEEKSYLEKKLLALASKIGQMK